MHGEARQAVQTLDRHAARKAAVGKDAGGQARQPHNAVAALCIRWSGVLIGAGADAMRQFHDSAARAGAGSNPGRWAAGGRRVAAGSPLRSVAAPPRPSSRDARRLARCSRPIACYLTSCSASREWEVPRLFGRGSSCTAESGVYRFERDSKSGGAECHALPRPQARRASHCHRPARFFACPDGTVGAKSHRDARQRSDRGQEPPAEATPLLRPAAAAITCTCATCRSAALAVALALLSVCPP